MRWGYFLVFSSALFLTIGTSAARPLTVLTSFLPLYSFTANVTGDAATVEVLLPPNVEPHDYQLTVKDRARIERADLIVFLGLGLDDWLEQAIAGSTRAIPRIAVSSAVTDHLLLTSGKPNPHIWLDPLLASRCVTNIVQALAKLSPENAELFERNGSNYVAQLQALDQEIRALLGPVQNRSIVTFHDSFPYLARRYGITVAGVIEPTPEISPSPRYLAQLYRTIRQTGVKCIFTEPQFRSSIARMVSEDLNLPMATLNTLESGTATLRSYEIGMRQNAKTLAGKLK